MKRINKPTPRKGAHIPTPQEPPSFDSKPPIFSLEKIVDGKYCLSSLNQEDKAFFADAIFRRKNLPWIEIKKQDRHALGIEKIARNCITVAIPRFITEDVDHFLAFRFHGFKPMVGYRNRDVFYVLWFDHDFTLYDHG